MAWISVMSACIVCRRVFTYNPLRVPSLRIDGAREPVCLECITAVNPGRVAKGLPAIEPLPGAYDPIDEHDWIPE